MVSEHLLLVSSCTVEQLHIQHHNALRLSGAAAAPHREIKEEKDKKMGCLPASLILASFLQGQG